MMRSKLFVPSASKTQLANGASMVTSCTRIVSDSSDRVSNSALSEPSVNASFSA